MMSKPLTSPILSPNRCRIKRAPCSFVFVPLTHARKRPSRTRHCHHASLRICRSSISAKSCCSCETRLTTADSPSTTLVRSAALRASEAGRAGSGHSLQSVRMTALRDFPTFAASACSAAFQKIVHLIASSYHPASDCHMQTKRMASDAILPTSVRGPYSSKQFAPTFAKFQYFKAELLGGETSTKVSFLN